MPQQFLDAPHVRTAGKELGCVRMAHRVWGEGPVQARKACVTLKTATQRICAHAIATRRDEERLRRRPFGPPCKLWARLAQVGAEPLQEGVVERNDALL